MANSSLLERYKNGQHEDVWDELRSHEVISGDLREEAMAVAVETMTRVGNNVNLIAGRLEKAGWTPQNSYREMPDDTDLTFFSEAEKKSGAPMPVSLEAFWKVVGGVDFVWDYRSGAEPPKLGPNLQMDEMDPLLIYSGDVMHHMFDEWDEMDFPEEGEDECFSIWLAPDHFHKANISGGDPYVIYVPFRGADPIVENEDHELPFVDYLRHCFRFGGFSKLDEYKDRADVKAFVQSMTEGLQPF